MTVSALTNRNDYVGNGNVDTYAYGFKIFADSELLVTVRDTDDVETELTLTTHYTVTGAGSASGGNVVLVGTASFDWIDADGDLESGYVLTIKRNPALKQLTDIRNQGSFFPESHENQFDKLVMIDQKQQDEIDRSAKLPVTIDPDDVDMTLPVPVGGQFLAWKSDESGLENQSMDVTELEYPGTISAGADASKAASPTANDIYVATDTKIVYYCFTSGTWTGFSLLYGLDASKPASPKVGQKYMATDTQKNYDCYADGTWTEIRAASMLVAITQAAHGFVAGDVLRHNGTSYVKALADTEDNSQATVIVLSSVSSTVFIGCLGGLVTGLSGLTAGAWHYLSPTSAGALTATKPKTAGQVIKSTLFAIGTTSGYFMPQESYISREYRESLQCKQATTTTLTVHPGMVEFTNGKRVRKLTAVTLTLSTAGDWAGGSSLRATSTPFYIGMDASGNLKLHTTAPTHSDYAVATTTGKKRYATWSGTVYRIIGWGYMNATGSGEIQSYSVSNLKEWGILNRVKYELSTFTDFATSTALPHDNTKPQKTEGDAFFNLGFIVGGGNVRLRSKVNMGIGGAGQPSICAFKDADADALKTSFGAYIGSNEGTGAYLEYEGALTEYTYATYYIRGGYASTAGVEFNGSDSQARYNNTMDSFIEIEEVD